MNTIFSGETHRPGRIEVVCGSMFSGKTEESLQSINQTLTHCSEQLTDYLHSLFNIKDLEVLINFSSSIL